MNAQNRYVTVLLTVRLLYCQPLSSSVDEVGPVDDDWQCKRRNAALLDKWLDFATNNDSKSY